MAVESTMFLSRMKSFNALAIYTVAELIVSAIDNVKTMAGGHAVHERQAVLSTTVVISHTFCMENEKELTPRGAWQ